MEIKDENKLCYYVTVNLQTENEKNKKKIHSSFLCPLNRTNRIGGNILNLIKAFFTFPEIWLQWEMMMVMMSHCNENTKKSKPRCYFLSLLWCYVFFLVLCLKYGKLVLRVTPSPPVPLTRLSIQWWFMHAVIFLFVSHT